MELLQSRSIRPCDCETRPPRNWLLANRRLARLEARRKAGIESSRDLQTTLYLNWKTRQVNKRLSLACGLTSAARRLASVRFRPVPAVQRCRSNFQKADSREDD